MGDIVLKPGAGFEYYKHEIYWNNFDQVRQRINHAISGDNSVGWVEHLRRVYGVRQSALFISCGNGWVERDCFRAGLIGSAIGFDVLPGLVATAEAEARKIGMPARYFQADGNALEADGLASDLIVNHGAMHHIAYIDRLTRQLAGLVKPAGIYVIHDYTGPHRNQYGWDAMSRYAELHHALPEEYRTKLSYAHVPTMLAQDPTEAIHSELQMDILARYFDIQTHVQFGGALAYSLLYQNRALYRDQHTDRGAACIARILEADQKFLAERPESNLFTYAVCTPKPVRPRKKQLEKWTREEEEREARAQENGGRYYPPTALELICHAFAARQNASPATPAPALVTPSPVAPGAWTATLLAPPEGPGSAWHNLETNARGSFRWSAQTMLSWRVALPAGSAHMVQIRIPYALEVRDGLAADCRISIGGVTAAPDCREGAIVAEARDVPPGDILVTLELPELLRPSDLGVNGDTRLLGLAIPVASVAAISADSGSAPHERA